MFAWRQVLAATDTRAGRARNLQNFRHFMIQLVGRRIVVTAGREDGETQRAGDKAVREIFQQVIDSLLCLIQRILHAPMDQRQIRFITAFIVITFQHRRCQVKLAQHVAETRGDTFATLQAAAQYRH